MSEFKLPIKEYKSEIRAVKADKKSIGGETCLPFICSEQSKPSSPLVSLEVLLNIPPKYPQELKTTWGSCINSPIDWVKEALKYNIDFLTIRFNIEEENLKSEIEKSVKLLQEVLSFSEIPLIVVGSGKRDIDIKLLPELAKVSEKISKTFTIGVVEEETYKDIIPLIMHFGHNIIARTPIDVNLAKELNILISELGVDKDKILIDPNMGGLGYGLDYGYSVIERIKQAGLDGDLMLNMPIVTFVGEESWKAKESKSDNFSKNWGNLSERALIWECITASSIMIAGANLLIMWHPKAAAEIKKFIETNKQER